MPKKNNGTPPLAEDRAVNQDGEVTPQAGTLHTVTSASVGTALTVGAGSISAFSMAQPTNLTTDDMTQLVLVDSAAAPTGYAKVLWAANLRALACMIEPRPGIGLTPGLTAPTWPKVLMGSTAIPFTNGCFVQSCPANTSFSVTA
jgi:hypothetical protein